MVGWIPCIARFVEFQAIYMLYQNCKRERQTFQNSNLAKVCNDTNEAHFYSNR